jgi:hypothetical protein
MSKKTPSPYLPNSDKDSLVIARECLPAGKAVANPDNIRRSALFEGKNHKIVSVVRLHDRPLELIKPQIIGKKAIPSRRLCQILILASTEKSRFFCYIGFSKKLKLSAASCGESSILMEQYRSAFARLPRSKLRGMRSLPNSILALHGQ